MENKLNPRYKIPPASPLADFFELLLLIFLWIPLAAIASMVFVMFGAVTDFAKFVKNSIK
jgi:hypothetical protein